MISIKQAKIDFCQRLKDFVKSLNSYVSTQDRQWTIKGFIDIYRNIYTISADTKVLSKILEIHLFPKILEFAQNNDYAIVLPEHQNYYPDLSFVSIQDERIKFAVDLKTTYRLPDYPGFCNGFTLGSHGEYFINRNSTKNIQFPYKDYVAHFCLGIIYSRTDPASMDEVSSYQITQLRSITSVIHDLQFFVTEKWRLASDRSGSGNTANIGSIYRISDILSGNGMFSRLDEPWFDDYWMNYGKITMTTKTGSTKPITSLIDFIAYRGGDPNLIVPKSRKRRARKQRNNG